MPKRTSPPASRVRTRLADLRWQRFKNQQQFARALGVSQQTASKYELGHLLPPAETRKRIADLVGRRASYIWPDLKRAA